MHSHKEIKILSNSAKEIYDLVFDVEKYPEFLPWCSQAKITKKHDERHFEADLTINFKGFSHKYSSDVRAGKIDDDDYLISVVAIDGPFKNLVNQWQFKDLAKRGDDKKCEVKFFIEFEFRSKILNKLMGFVWHKATQKMIGAFEKRAQEIYR